MKIEIDLMDILSLEGQLEAVEKYIRNNSQVELQRGKFCASYPDKINIKTTPKNTGEKIKTTYKNYHVSCHKTKGGTYKFKTWQAI